METEFLIYLWNNARYEIAGYALVIFAANYYLIYLIDSMRQSSSITPDLEAGTS